VHRHHAENLPESRTKWSLLINAAIVDGRYSLSMATLRVHLVPNAKIDKVVGEHGGAIKSAVRNRAIR